MAEKRPSDIVAELALAAGIPLEDWQRAWLGAAVDEPPPVVHLITDLGPTDEPGFIVPAQLGRFGTSWSEDGVLNAEFFYYDETQTFTANSWSGQQRPPGNWTVS